MTLRLARIDLIIAFSLVTTAFDVNQGGQRGPKRPAEDAR